METTKHNGITTIIFNEQETKLLIFYEKHKNDSVSLLARKYNKKPKHVRQWLDEGKRLANL